MTRCYFTIKNIFSFSWYKHTIYILLWKFSGNLVIASYKDSFPEKTKNGLKFKNI